MGGCAGLLPAEVGEVMGEHERARASADDSRCDDCDEARRRAAAGLVQCTCGAWHGDDGARWPARGVIGRARAASGPRLALHEGEVPPPSAPLRRVRESEEVARARRLLAELRPHGPGPAEALDGDGGGGASLAPRAGARAPWDVALPAAQAHHDRGGAAAADVVARIGRATLASPRAGASLAWLRRSGTLLHGYAVLAAGLARWLAEPSRRAAWDAAGDAGRDRARVWGAARLDEACAAWDAAGRDER